MISATGQPYEYAGDDPVNERDPSGMDPTGGAAFITKEVPSNCPLPALNDLSSYSVSGSQAATQQGTLASSDSEVGASTEPDAVTDADLVASPLAECVVKPQLVHESSSRTFNAVNEHVNVDCNQVVSEFIVVVQLWKTGFLGFNHKVGPAQPGFGFDRKYMELVDYSAVCTNHLPTVWFGSIVAAHGTALDGNPMLPVGPLVRSNDSESLECGT
jgi:hypothetical protein